METINWLLNSDPYVEYATRVHILKEDKNKLSELKNKVLEDVRIKRYLNDVADFNGMLVTNHKNPDLPIHKLLFLLEVGLDEHIDQIHTAINKILSNKDEDGIYKCMTNVPVHFGGTGTDTLAWCLCDAPLMLYALLKAGLSYGQHVKTGVDYMIGLNRQNGFPCAVSKELGKFRGPGRKDDCCPYATLIMLKLLSLIPEYKDSEIAETTVDALLGLWENSRDQHPYIFYMGNDFRKLKAPAVWYDIVNVIDCLSHFEYARKDPRFIEMLDVIEGKANAEFQFTPESIYLKCKDWDFGQKKEPSPWLTYLCLSILKRCGRISYI